MLEGGAADAVLEGGAAPCDQCARVRWTRLALQLGREVLERVGGTLVAEARQAVPAELACSARPARVRCISLEAQATDAVAEARAPGFIRIMATETSCTHGGNKKSRLNV